MKSYNVILASASPRRAQLIKKIPWLNATVFAYNGQEPIYNGGSVQEFVCKSAQIKAQGVLAVTGGTVIGADTVVCLDGKVLGKPKDFAEAESMFKMLCGRTHSVITGYCVANCDKIAINFEKTYVTFGAFIDNIVYNYIYSGAPYDKAGGYGLQDGELSPLILRVDGDRDNVVGLPVNALEKTIKEFLGCQ